MRILISLSLLFITQYLFSQEKKDTMLISKIEKFSEQGELISLEVYEYDNFNNCIKSKYNNYVQNYMSVIFSYYDNQNRLVCKTYYENDELMDSMIFKYKDKELYNQIEYRGTNIVVNTWYYQYSDSLVTVTLEIENRTPQNFKPNLSEGTETPQFLEIHRRTEIKKLDSLQRPTEITYYYFGGHSRDREIGKKPYLDSLQGRIFYTYDDKENISTKKEYLDDDSIAHLTTIYSFDNVNRPLSMVTYQYESDSIWTSDKWVYLLISQGLSILHRSSFTDSYDVEIKDNLGRTVERSSITGDGFILTRTSYVYNDSGYVVEVIYEYFFDQQPINTSSDFQTFERIVYTYK